MPVELHAHQDKAVGNMHNGCILLGGVGVGKTITSLAYYVTKVCHGELNKWGSMKTPKRLVVVTTAKVRDSKAFELQAAQMGIFADPKLSTNGVSIEVTSWNKINDYKEVRDAFFIFDEQRVVGYGAWSKAFIEIAKHNEWVMLSATPGDTWLDYLPVFIANGFYKHKTDFTDQHVIWQPYVKYNKVQRYVGIGTLVRRRNEVLVHMPFDRHTTRHHVYIDCEYDEVAFEKASKKKWHVYENRPLRDMAECFSVLRKIVNSDQSRLRAVEKLLQKHPKLIVFYNFDYELEMLRTLGHVGASSDEKHTCPPWEVDASVMATCNACVGELAVAEWNGHNHQEIPAESARWVYLVQYRAGAEGWNCIDTDAMCLWSQTYSYRDHEQVQGRIDRINTPFTDLWYYHLVSKSLIDKAIGRALKAKKSFNERDLAL